MPTKPIELVKTFPQTLKDPKGYVANPFQEQVDFFRQKINLPTERWDDIKKSAHDKAFVVAGATKADLVADFRLAVDKAIHDGESLGEFRKRFDQIVAKHGWAGWKGEGSQAGRDWRTSVIYQTNMSVSYAAGRWAQLHDPDLIKMMPYLTYVHHDTRHPRPIHLSWNGFTAPRDHKFWATHAVPNDWLCHCSIEAASEADYAAAKAAGKHEPPAGWNKINPNTGEQVGIGKGFGYAPGANVRRPLKAFIDQKLIKLDAPMGAEVWKSLAPVLNKEQLADVSKMVAVAAASMEATGESVVAHVIEPQTVAALSKQGVELVDAAVWLRDHELIHAIRDSKDFRGAMLPLEVWLNLPNYLKNAKVYLDTIKGNLLYAFDLPNVTGKIVVRVNYSKKVNNDGKRERVLSNFVVTGGLIEAENLNAKQYVLLQ